jgi:hypothetical protein
METGRFSLEVGFIGPVVGGSCAEVKPARDQDLITGTTPRNQLGTQMLLVVLGSSNAN